MILKASKGLYETVMQNRSLWLFLVRRVLYEERIPETALSLPMMDTPSLVRILTRKSSLVWQVRNGSPVACCRRIDITFDFPMPSTESAIQELAMDDLREPYDNLTKPMLLPGGRWIVGISGGKLKWFVSCWDIQAFNTDTSSPLAPAVSYELRAVRDDILSPPAIQKFEYNDHDSAFNILVETIYPGSHWYAHSAFLNRSFDH